MHLLLDTHALLWALIDDPTLSSDARTAIVDPTNVVYASAVSGWEIAIKRGLGRLRAPDDLEEQVLGHRFTPLDVTFAHAAQVGRLPDVHRDPFARLLVAQAIVERLTLVTRDKHLGGYGVETVTA